MNADTEYHTLLRELAALPERVRAENADVEDRHRRTIDDADRAWRREQERWKADDQRADDLRRQVVALARKVGAPTPASTETAVLDEGRISLELNEVRKRIDAANSSWQWILRQEERDRLDAQRAAVTPPPPPPPPPPAPVVRAPEPPAVGRPALNTTVLAAAVVGVLLLILIVMLVV